MKNELQFETSPYLKQHEDNPVRWYAWNAKTLELARTQDRPILLSIGYSSCHWCHVMAHESFENPDIAQVMNENFINIKVDREERPDLDHIYQNVAQIFTHGGGWPLTVFLTPELKPYYGGTYFPPEDRWGRPGFSRLLKALSDAYRSDRLKVAQNSEKIMAAIQDLESVTLSKGAGQEITFAGLLEAGRKLLRIVDFENGGFGQAPKFPNASALVFLMRTGALASRRDPEFSNSAKKAVLVSLDSMLNRGLFDPIGGGFHRYSVDEAWRVPHFEKMLYDNASLLKLYSEALIINHQGPWKGFLGGERSDLYFDQMQLTVEYLKREMLSEEGLFFSAQDADSEGKEGKFFVWTYADLHEALGDQADVNFAAKVFGVTEEGNFEHSGESVLSFLPAADKTQIDKIRRRLFAFRERRIKPGLDDKTLVSWNALMIEGLVTWAKALQCTNQDAEPAFGLAREVFTKIHRLAGSTGYRLKSTIQKGQARFNGYLDDYAFMARAALSLGMLDHARGYLGTMIDQFKDPEGLGFYFTSHDHENLIQRPKSLQDQSIPSSNGVAYQLAQVFEIDLDSEFLALFDLAKQSPYGFAEILVTALHRWSGSEKIQGAAESVALSWFHQVFEKAEYKTGKVQRCLEGICQESIMAEWLEDSIRDLMKKADR